MRSLLRPGRRSRTPDEVRQLILRIAREIGWGSTRISGEMRKLGLTAPPSTVRNILKAEGFDPGPDRSEGSWDEFLKIHAATLWAFDFVRKPTWTIGGLIDFYFLVFIHLQTRRLIVTPCTASPNGDWVAQQARNFVIEAKRVGPMKPNLNAYAKRVVQSIQQECLDHFVVFGPKHLNYLVGEYAQHHNDERVHIATGRPPRGMPRIRDGDGDVVWDKRLGGLLRSYRRAA